MSDTTQTIASTTDREVITIDTNDEAHYDSSPFIGEGYTEVTLLYPCNSSKLIDPESPVDIILNGHYIKANETIFIGSTYFTNIGNGNVICSSISPEVYKSATVVTLSPESAEDYGKKQIVVTFDKSCLPCKFYDPDMGFILLHRVGQTLQIRIRGRSYYFNYKVVFSDDGVLQLVPL